MNFSFLPEKIKKELGEFAADKLPRVIRLSGTVEGEPGEGYIVSHGGSMLVFSRKLGGDAYARLGGKFGGEVCSVGVRKESLNSFLDFEIGGRKYSVKVSSFDDSEVAGLCESFKKLAGGADVQPQAADTAEPQHQQDQFGQSVPELDIAPIVALGAAMMYISAVDKAIFPEEDTYIARVFKSNKRELKEALRIFKSTPYDKFLQGIRRLLSSLQKECVLANMLEIAMQDGSYQTEEQELVEKFVTELQVSRTAYEKLLNTLLVKNNLSVF